MTLFVASELGGQVVVEAGETLTVQERGVLVSEADFLALVTSVDSLKLLRRQKAAAEEALVARDSLLAAYQRRLEWQAESYDELVKVYKERPKPSLLDELGKYGLAVTGGALVAGVAFCN